MMGRRDTGSATLKAATNHAGGILVAVFVTTFPSPLTVD
jgi:hypothetical protein